MVNKLLIIILVVGFHTLHTHSVQAQILEGRVKDRDTGEPVPAANIFFSRTQQGTFSDEKGAFTISIPPLRSLELVISHVSYQTRIINITVEDLTSGEMEILLDAKEIRLQEIEVVSTSDRQWKRTLRKFSRAFLGNTDNAKKCDIINPQVINFSAEDNSITATADDILEINNKATGYRIYFLLEHFSMKGPEVTYSGKPFFEPLPPPDIDQLNSWLRNRERTFKGSLRHFLQVSIEGQALNEGYKVFRGRINANGEFEAAGPMTSSGLIKKEEKSGNYILDLQDMLKIVYAMRKSNNNSISEGPFDRMKGTPDHELDKMGRGQDADLSDFQTSFLFGLKPRIIVYPKGILARPELVKTYGFWAEKGIADLLPYDYSPGN